MNKLFKLLCLFFYCSTLFVPVYSAENKRTVKVTEEYSYEETVSIRQVRISSPFVDYTKYGDFKNIGTKNYKYVINNKEGLAKTVGLGVYPNTDVKKSATYKSFKNKGLISDEIWDHVGSGNPKLDFYAWAGSDIVEPNFPRNNEGIKQFFAAEALSEAGEVIQAIKAYYSIVIHFPHTACWGSDLSFVWYVAPAAIERIHYLCREHPEIGFKLVDASVEIKNKDDVNLNNDIVVVNPGRFVSSKYIQKINLQNIGVDKTVLNGKVKLIKYNNGHWQMNVDGKPFVVKGVTYYPTKVGKGPAEGPNFSLKWMFEDYNKNNKSDSAYDTWVDINRNNKKDKNEQIIGDFALMASMGVNAIRIFNAPNNKNKYESKNFNKEVLRDLYNTYGIRVIMSDYLGAYCVGSGANPELGTDYTNSKQKRLMKNIVKGLIRDHRDEPYVLMWLLGNENDMPINEGGVNATLTNASEYPEAYAKFVNDVAHMIHSLDPNHPVMVGNMSLDLVDAYRKFSPNIDIYGMNAYRGSTGFGSLFTDLKEKMDIPIIITEYGCDAYDERYRKVNEEAQAEYHRGTWGDIKRNLAGDLGAGICLGGIVFEWVDEWWKDTRGNAANEHSTNADYPLPFFDGFAHEEWFGMTGQGNGQNSPFQRNLRKAYYLYKELWNKKE